MRFRHFGLVLVLVLWGASTIGAFAQGKSRIMPLATYKMMLAANKDTGWVQFRNYSGKQLIYFSAVQTLHCRLKEIRYSINSEALDKTFNIVACNPQTPFSMPPKFSLSDIALQLPKGSANIIVVQIVWEDDSKSEIVVYEPCQDVGEQTCAWPSHLNRVNELQSANRTDVK